MRYSYNYNSLFHRFTITQDLGFTIALQHHWAPILLYRHTTTATLLHCCTVAQLCSYPTCQTNDWVAWCHLCCLDFSLCCRTDSTADPNHLKKGLFWIRTGTANGANGANVNEFESCKAPSENAGPTVWVGLEWLSNVKLSLRWITVSTWFEEAWGALRHCFVRRQSVGKLWY